MSRINETHNPALRSWVDSANLAGSDFPIQNLPVGVFSHPGSSGKRGGIAIGDMILDLGAAAEAGLFAGAARDAPREPRYAETAHLTLQSAASNPKRLVERLLARDEVRAVIAAAS